MLRAVLGVDRHAGAASSSRPCFWLLVYRLWLASSGSRFRERERPRPARDDRVRVDALFAPRIGFASSTSSSARACRRAT